MGNQEKKTCPQCGSGEFYVRKDKSIFCRKCGHDTRTKKEITE